MNFKKILAMLLVVCMLAAVLASCGDNKDNNNSKPEESKGEGSQGEVSSEESEEEKNPLVTEWVDEFADLDELTDEDEVYKAALYEFYCAYQQAKAQTDLGLRYAMMAQAEALLLETGVMLPLSTQGGNYAVSRVAPNGVGKVLWGNDSDRLYNVVVADKILLASERAELKKMWSELRGTGTYEAKVKEYLTNKGYKIKDTYDMGYSSDPKTWDALATSRAADSEAIVNTYDGLLEYNCEGIQVPALATGYTVSEDGLTYTFTIREGVKWVDNQGREVADVKADDFVAGIQHSVDAKGGLSFLVDGVIANMGKYILGEITDFSEVGVTAVDDKTLVYTLEAPCSYFLSMVGYNIFAPMSRSYYESKGGKFGEDFTDEYKASEAYTYGKDPESIAYCGPYLVTNCTAENTIVFEANPKYWNKDEVNVKKITWKYNDGKIATKAFEDAINGVLDGAGLNAAALKLCKENYPEVFENNVYISDTNATSFMAFFNIKRESFANFNDDTKAVSAKTEAQKADAKVAMLNANFRRALTLSLDRASYNAQTQGEELKLASLRNTYTPGDFVALPNDATIVINGEEVTFEKGTFYGAIMQAQLDADGFPVKVWDADNSTSDQFDGWYNPEEAVKYLDKAIDELKAEGVEVSAENPIVIDLPAFAGSEVYLNRANVMKQSVENVLGGKVILNIVECPDSQDWYNAGYYTEKGEEANYDIYDVSGWGPDYGDPSTYLDTFLPFGAGYMVKCIGLYSE